MKKKLIIIAAAVGATLLIIAGIYIASRVKKDDGFVETETTALTTSAESTVASSETEAEPEPPFVSKKDFDSLREQYPHIYAWIEIPGTVVDYPIVQHPDNDEYYLRRDAEGNYSVNGCIFSEHRYNATDFSDPITMLYGHYVYEYDGYKYFGGLQSTYRDDLETYGEIIVYHPEKELHYKIFAAVPYNSYHVLYARNFKIPKAFNSFVDGIKSIEEYGANVNRDYEVEAGDNLLVLSTCYNGNTDRRFLVVAKLVETID